MDYQISSSTTNTKDNWVGPGIYRLMSAANNGKYIAVNGQDHLVVASCQKTDTKQQWQISYAGKRHLEGDPKVAFVAEFFIINVETGKYLISDKGVLSMGVSSPKFDGKSRWVIVNKRITEKSQKIDDRYIFYTWKENQALACKGAQITSIKYNSNDQNQNDCQWHIVDNITK